MKAWEANNDHHLFELLVGDWYGENPEKKLNLLREDKEKRAQFLIKELALNNQSIALEIGSGVGFTSKHIAKAVKELHCCDISASFLDYAKRECEGIQNISFYNLENPQDLPFESPRFDVIFADAVFIHLNLYDIYLYFDRFKKIVKSGGTVWFNIMNENKIDVEKLKEMAQFYRDDSNSLKMLLCWNSASAVIEVASYFGFSVVSKNYDANVDLKFIKRN